MDDLSIHLLRCSCGNECIATHNRFQDIIVAIALESGIHMQKVFYLFPCHTWKWMDVVITRDNSWTLMDVVITNLTCIDLVQRVSTMITHVVTIVAHKAWSYTKQTSRDDFVPLAIETYDCLHPHFDFFLTSCVHANIIHN